MSRARVGVLGGLASLMISVGAAMPASAASEISDTGSVALAKVAACAAQQQSVLVAIVVDESGSLQTTDPNSLRVGAIETALDSLESLSSQSGNAVAVEASLATFGKTYDELVGWGPVDGQHGDDLRAAVSNQLPNRNKALFTDYRAALRGAQASLDARAAALPGDECRLVLWFTDGKLDADNDGGNGPLTQKAKSDICVAQGIADALRADNIAVVALALFTEGAANSPSPEDRALLRAIAEGQAGETVCGTTPMPPTWSPGAYLRADNADALRATFAQAGALIEGGVQADVLARADGELVVPVDRGVSRFRVVVTRALEESPISVVAPDGSTAVLVAGSSRIGDAEATATSAPGLSTIQLTVPAGSVQFGDWRFNLGDGANNASVYYFWDASLTLEAPENLVIGDRTDIPIRLLSPTGEELDTAVYGTYEVEASAEGAEVKVSADNRTLSVTLSGDSVPSEITITASAVATSAPTQIVLGPTYAGATLGTALPPSYPTVSPAALVFSDLVGTSEATAVLTVQGSDRGETKACFEGTEVSGPADAGAVSIESPVACVTLAAGEVRAVTLVLTTDHPADGRIDGTVSVKLTGVGTDAPITVNVPATASMERPVNETERWLLVAGFVLLALLVAWLTALVGRHFADRYRFGPGAQYCAVDVEITPDGVRRLGATNSELVDTLEDFRRVSTIGSKTTTTTKDIAGLKFRRKSPLNPWRTARGVVMAPGRIVASGEHAEMERPDGSVAPARFPGTTGFVLSADPRDVAPSRATALLVMVLDAPHGVSTVLPERLEELRHVLWVDVLGALNSAAEAVRAGAASEAAPTDIRGVRRPTRNGKDSERAQGGDFGLDERPRPDSPRSPASAEDWLGDGGDTSPTTTRDEPPTRAERGRRAPRALDRDDTPPPPIDFLN